MSLRDQAAADLRTILEDVDGFGWPITVTDPAGTTAALTGFSSDIGETIDPDTGLAVSGRRASVAIPIAALTDAGLGIPRGVHDSSTGAWRVSFDDSAGNTHTLKVSGAFPDRAIGAVTCWLEAYQP